MTIREKLHQLKITLPPTPTPAAGAYIPAKRVGNLIFIAGQLPIRDGAILASGPVPSRCSMESATAAARQCVLNALAAVEALPGGVEQIDGVVRVGVFVQSDNDFKQQALVGNGASELLLDIFGPAGQHARAAVGVNTLPRDTSVEIEFLFSAR